MRQRPLFLDSNLSVSGNIIITKIYDKRYDFKFDFVNFPFWVDSIPRATSYGKYISQLIISGVIVKL